VSLLKFFYTYTPHTCALASHIALEEAGSGYEAVRVDLKKNAQRAPEYLAVNPKARVPSLATDLGILTLAQRLKTHGVDPGGFQECLIIAHGWPPGRA
jgi:glutathione S-transferase